MCTTRCEKTGEAPRTIPFKGARGSALVGIIVAIVVMGALGAGMVALLGTSTFHEVRANHGERAYYLAESGFRYAASVYTSEGKDELEKLQGKEESLPGGGRFKLDVKVITYSKPSDAATDGKSYPDPNTFTLKGGWAQGTVESPVFVAPDDPIPSGHNLQVEVDAGDDLPRFRGRVDIGGIPVRYQRRSGPIIDGDKALYTLHRISYDNTGGDLLAPDPSTGLEVSLVYPIEMAEVTSTGTFGSGLLAASRSVIYAWTLSGSDGWQSGDELEVFDPSDFPGGQQPVYEFTPMSGSDWHIGPQGGPGQVAEIISDQTYVHPGGGTYQRSALRVFNYRTLNEGTNEEIRYNYFPFKHNAANLGIKQAWEKNDELLSYDVQIKVGTGPMLSAGSVGFMFRAEEQGQGQNTYYSGYGISFMRYGLEHCTSVGSDPNYTCQNWTSNIDYMPQGVKPVDASNNNLDGHALLVLWKQTGMQSWEWIAYKRLHMLDRDTRGCRLSQQDSRIFLLGQEASAPLYDTYVQGGQYCGDGYFIHDDSTLMIRVVEKIIDGKRVNDIQLFFGDYRMAINNQTGRTQNTDAYDTESGRYGYHHHLAPTGTQLWRWPSLPNISSQNWDPQENDWFTAVNWDQVNPNTGAVKLTTHGGTSIVRDDSFTTEELKNNMNKIPEFVIHTFANACDPYHHLNCGPIHFVDFGVRLLKGSGDGIAGEYIGPIQR